jgi:hypothetical protein
LNSTSSGSRPWSSDGWVAAQPLPRRPGRGRTRLRPGRALRQRQRAEEIGMLSYRTVVELERREPASPQRRGPPSRAVRGARSGWPVSGPAVGPPLARACHSHRSRQPTQLQPEERDGEGMPHKPTLSDPTSGHGEACFRANLVTYWTAGCSPQAGQAARRAHGRAARAAVECDKLLPAGRARPTGGATPVAVRA